MGKEETVVSLVDLCGRAQELFQSGRYGKQGRGSLPMQRHATRLRLVSIFRRGWVLILVALLRQVPLPLGAFLPEPWPSVPTRDQDLMITPVGAYHDVAA